MRVSPRLPDTDLDRTPKHALFRAAGRDAPENTGPECDEFVVIPQTGLLRDIEQRN
jgi:hypothetical protein